MPAWLHWEGKTLVLDVLVQPRASKSAVVGEHGQCLKVRVSAPPVQGGANEQLCKLIAKEFGVGKAAVGVRTGHRARRKTLTVHAPRLTPRWLLASSD